MEKELIRAIHPNDVSAVLARLGLLDDLNAGRISCSSCGAPLTTETLRAIARVAGELRVLCTLPECLLSAKPEPPTEVQS